MAQRGPASSRQYFAGIAGSQDRIILILHAGDGAARLSLPGTPLVRRDIAHDKSFLPRSTGVMIVERHHFQR
jgi:hypothetical protein